MHLAPVGAFSTHGWAIAGTAWRSQRRAALEPHIGYGLISARVLWLAVVLLVSLSVGLCSFSFWFWFYERLQGGCTGSGRLWGRSIRVQGTGPVLRGGSWSERTQNVGVRRPARPVEGELMGDRKRWNWDLAGGTAEVRAHATGSCPHGVGAHWWTSVVELGAGWWSGRGTSTRDGVMRCGMWDGARLRPGAR